MPSGKDIEDARDALRGVVGVQGREHQVPGFGGGERRRHGFGVAHFAHQDHVGILPQDSAHRCGKRGRVVADLDLLHDGVAVRVLYSTGSSMVMM